MPTYTNPTGTFNATSGDDSIIYNINPGGSGFVSVIDALSGNDSVFAQISSANPMTFDVSDIFNSGTFRAWIQLGPYDAQMIVYDVENVDLRGGVSDDYFTLKLGSSTAGLSVNFDGGVGNDSLVLDGSKLVTGLSFVVTGSTIASSFGSFASFEKFEIRTGSGNDTIVTGSANDNIYTGTGIDNVNAGGGNDYIYSQATGGVIDGGAGSDFFSGGPLTNSPQTITIGDTSIDFSGQLTVKNIEGYSIGGGDGDDVFNINTTNGGNVYGGAGRDTLVYNYVPTSAVQLTIEAHGDQLYGTLGPVNNQISFNDFENVTVSGSQFNDYIRIWGSYSGSGLSVNAGAGSDFLQLDFAGAQTGFTFIVQPDGTVSSSLGSIIGFETFELHGGYGADIITGGAGDDRITGGNGADQIDGGAGNDVLSAVDEGMPHWNDGAPDIVFGGSGNDTIFAGYGDTVNGGSGTDFLHYDMRAATSGVTANFAQLTSGGTITIGGATLTSIETLGFIDGTNFADNITAGLSGGGGAHLSGWDGDDRLIGTSAGDTIDGGKGNDIITGGLGADTILDGDGDNTYLDTKAGLNGDTINGFGPGDKLVITDATLSNFTFNFSGNVLNYSGGSLTLNTDFPAQLVATAAPGGGVQLQMQLPPVGTYDQIANQLVSGYWNGQSHHWNVTQGGTITVNMSMLTTQEQDVARTALGVWADVIGVNFQEVSSGGQIVFDNTYVQGQGAYTDSTFSNGLMTSAVVHIPGGWTSTYGSYPGSFGFETFVHEIGHALGLGHPGNYNFNATFLDALFFNDSQATSVMSYFDQNYYFANQGFSAYSPGTPMLADIAALQRLYGLSTTTRTGDTTYGFNSNAGGVFASSGPVALTIFDSGGNDTLDYSNVYYPQLLNLNPETFSNVDAGVGNLAIARGTIIENAIGGMGADTLIGNAVANILSGRDGSDTLSGGAGNDTFRDTRAGLTGDTITDFSAGDRIIFTDASLASFAFSLTGNVLTFTGGSLTLGAPVVGTISATAASGGGVQLTISQFADVRYDLNGDGRSDVLWRSNTGELTNWLGQANGGFTANANGYAMVATSWQVAAVADFNGDGRDDVLWRNSNGQMTNWLGQSNGSFLDNSANGFATVATAWQIAGAGDFNGDGIDDIAWRNSNGTMTNWLGTPSGGYSDNSANASVLIGNAWHVAGVGDFNGDGRDDILWRNDNGSLTDWLAQANGGHSNNSNASTSVATSWHIAGVGDFNGDGRDDILWRNDNGDMTNWLGQTDGGFANNPNASVWVPTSWHIEAVGDYNGDGRDDILWRNDNGDFTNWLGQANGGFVNNPFASTWVPTAWDIKVDYSLF